MIQLENPTLLHADAGPVTADSSANPMPHHNCGGKIGHQLAKSYWTHRPADAVCHHIPVRYAYQTEQP
jgi:hypothetical protein